MACKVDFHEVLIDSPNFRWILDSEKICEKKWKFLRKYFNFMCLCRLYLSQCLLCFRYKLEEQEQDIENLEQKLERILKLATASCDSGRQFVVNQRWVIVYILSATQRIPLQYMLVVLARKNFSLANHESPFIICFNWIQARLLLLVRIQYLRNDD